MDARQEVVERLKADRTFIDRLIGAAKFDVLTYEEVEHDQTLTGQAALVVVLVAVARAIGGLDAGTSGFIAGIIAALSMWLIWAGLTYLIGDKLLGGTATWGELLRTLGFAQAPGLLAVIGIIGIMGGLIEAVISIWMLFTGIVAIRQALDFGTGKAVLTAFLGWLVAMAFVVFIGITLGGLELVFG